MITRYKNPNYACLDLAEARLAIQEKFAGADVVARKLSKILNTEHLILTMGKSGSLTVDSDNEVIATPIFSSKVIDTVGAGDAVFAFTSPCFARNMPADLVAFIGNAIGALAVQIVCNKRAIEKSELLEFIYTLLP